MSSVQKNISDDCLILRRLHVPAGLVRPDLADLPTSVGLAIDVETTGLDPKRHAIIELAMRRFRYTEAAVITRIDQPYVWRENPGVPLDPAITKLTELTDADLAGQKIDDAKAIAILRSAHVIIAHNAAFDRKFVERRLPSCTGFAWACSLTEIDWTSRGFDSTGRILGWLLAQDGWFYNRHQAESDVDAVIQLMTHVHEGRSALRELLENAARTTWHVKAVGAHFSVKDRLKTRRYRWDPDELVWSREVADENLIEEKIWLDENIYAPECKARTSAPSIRAITWSERYAG